MKVIQSSLQEKKGIEKIEVNETINVVHLSELEDLREIPLQSTTYEPSAYIRIPLLILCHAYSSHPCGNASMYSRVSIVLLLRT